MPSVDKSMVFYCINPPQNDRLLATVSEDGLDLETIVCPLNAGHQRVGRRRSTLKAIVGAAAGDLVWTWPSDLLVSSRLRESIEKEQLSGLTFRPAEVVDRRGLGLANQFWEVVVEGWAGEASPASGIHLTDRCDGCGLLVYSCFTNPAKLVDVEKWDGSDFFIVWPMPRFIFVSHRALEFLNRHGPASFSAIPIEDLRCDSQLTPGRLSHWMSPQRAHALGHAIGID